MTTCQSTAKPEKYCYPAHKGPPRQVPHPTFSFDANGCVADREVINGCEGVDAVMSGPSIEGKNCCHRVCRGPTAPCGRPLFTVDGTTRVASTMTRSDWTSETAVDVRPVDSTLASRLRDAWLEDAAAEHASVAAFARFSLELLAVGAPASLVAEAQRAGLDEVNHARACYAMAGAYDRKVDPKGGGTRSEAGLQPLGPAALSLRGISLRSDLAEIAASAAEEACVGETFAALALMEARDGCEDPAVRDALAQIAGDEARHAELGFRFVAWAVAHGGAEVRTRVMLAFERAIARTEPVTSIRSEPFGGDDGWRAAGRLTDGQRHDVWRRAVLEVISPAIHALR